MEDSKEIKDRLEKVFSKVEIFTCKMCGAFLDKDEYVRSEGVCFKHWD